HVEEFGKGRRAPADAIVDWTVAFGAKRKYYVKADAEIEQDVENAVGHQRNTDDCNEQRDVFGEQAPASFCDRRFGRRWPRRARPGGLPCVPPTHEGPFGGIQVPAERLRPDDQIRSVWCRTPRTPWQSPSRARPPAHVRTKR